MIAKYFDSIDNCPILVFVLISEGKKDLSFLCIEGKPKEEDSLEAWKNVYAEYIENFGVSAEFIHYTRERLKLCEMLECFYVRGEKWQRILIAIKKNEIAQLEANMNTSSSDFNATIGKLSKRMGFGIDPMRTSIRQFYSYLKV